MQKKFESKPKDSCLNMAYFWGDPVIQAVEAKILGTFLRNIHIFTKYFVPEKYLFTQ